MSYDRLHYETVEPILKDILYRLMLCPLFDRFRLVGGTALSLQLGHRVSVDIDLFTDAEYGSIDFVAIQSWLRSEFPYCDGECGDNVGFGTYYMIGNSRNECIKLDLYYTDSFIRPLKVVDNIRMAAVEEIAAMKISAVSRGGRKKDFWDIHELHNILPFSNMLDLYEERYPFENERADVIKSFYDFSRADDEVDPRCLKGEIWQFIKMDILEWIEEIQ